MCKSSMVFFVACDVTRHAISTSRWKKWLRLFFFSILSFKGIRIKSLNNNVKCFKNSRKVLIIRKFLSIIIMEWSNREKGKRRKLSERASMVHLIIIVDNRHITNLHVYSQLNLDLAIVRSYRPIWREEMQAFWNVNKSLLRYNNNNSATSSQAFEHWSPLFWVVSVTASYACIKLLDGFVCVCVCSRVCLNG